MDGHQAALDAHAAHTAAHHSAISSSDSHHDPHAAMYERMQAMALFQQASAGSVYVLTTKGQDSQFGCCWGCKGDHVTCNFNPHFLPDELNGIISFTEFATMCNEIDQVLGETHLPMMPLIFTHFCIPFSPVCAMMYCASKRLKGIEMVLQKHTLTLVDRGYYWEQAPANMYNFGIAFLKVNKTVAARYNQAHPSTYEGSIAPSALVPTTDPTEYRFMNREVVTAEVVPSAPIGTMKREY